MDGRRDRLTEAVLDSLDEPRSTAALARSAFHSRSRFHHLFRAILEETPVAMRRRLQLERAAYQLNRTTTPITGIAFDAGYGSLEAFTRSFSRAFGASPSLFRRSGATYYFLPTQNGIHFRATAPSPSQGDLDMDLYEHFAGNESWHTQRLLECAKQLTAEQWNQPLDAAREILPWHEPNGSVGQLFENIVFTKEIWAAALLGKKDFAVNGPPISERTPEKTIERLAQADAELQKVFCDVRARGAWNEEFVDALCEPAEKFSYGGVFAHIITYNAHRRLQALDALRKLGLSPQGWGDPIEFELHSQGLTAPRTHQGE